MIVQEGEERREREGSDERATSAGDEVAAALKQARAHLDLWLDELQERARLALARGRMRLVQRAFQVAWLAALAVVIASASVAGAWMFARGLRGGLARVAPEWVADLAVGALALGAVALGLVVLRGRAYRGVLRGLRPADPAPPDEPEGSA